MIGLVGGLASACLALIVASVVTVLRVPDDMFDVFVEVDE